MARQDKNRYDLEKARYTGPWRVLKQRKAKDSNAPKRPMSAFLAFANSRRAEVKRQMPEADNGELSRALSKLWKDAPVEIRQQYIEEEKEKRKDYLVAIANWRIVDEEEKRVERLQNQQSMNRVVEENDTGFMKDADDSKDSIADMYMGKSSLDNLPVDTNSSLHLVENRSFSTSFDWQPMQPQQDANHDFSNGFNQTSHPACAYGEYSSNFRLSS